VGADVPRSARAGTGGRPETTHAQLWKAYTESQAFTSAAPKTRINYAERWRKWMHFRGERTKVDETTLLHVDQFYSRGSRGQAANQTRGIIAVARIVYNWGQSRKLVTQQRARALPLADRPKGRRRTSRRSTPSPSSSRSSAELSPQSRRTWRAHVALMLAGHQGMRANAVLHLAWPDVHEDEALFIWPAAVPEEPARASCSR
jgi:integrase